MYIVNTTYVVDPKIDDQWRKWIVNLMTNRKTILTKVLSEEPTDHLTYSLQIEAADVPQMQAVRQITAEPMPFGEKVLAFTTILKKIKL